MESVLTKVNLNSASFEELMTLPGIGKKTAEKIVIYRNNHGNFTNVDDLINVSGIGEKKLENIKKYILIE